MAPHGPLPAALRRALPLLISLVVGCKAVEPAPEDLDGQAHWFWNHFGDEGYEHLDDGLIKLHDASGAASLEETEDGSVSSLTAEETEGLGPEGADPSEAAGVYLLNVIHCPLEDVEWSVYTDTQAELHPGTYVSYDRAYTSDLDDYTAGKSDSLSWESDYEVEGFGATYSATVLGWLRRVPDQGEDLTPHGPFLVSRAVLDDEAAFEGSSESGIYQDYQLEVYWERAAGETAHLYAIWREMIYLGSASFDDEGIQRFVLNGLADWDDDTEAWCSSGR